MSWRIICTAAVLIFGLWAQAHATGFSGGDRLPVAAPEDSPYAAIGRVSWRQKAGTGFLVSECHVLSAKHVVSDRKSVLGRRVRFRVALRSGETVASAGTVIANGSFDVADQRANPAIGRSDDWMLVALDECLGRRLGYLDVTIASLPQSVVAEGPLRSAGYPTRSLGQMVIDPLCEVEDELGQEWLHDCASFPGDSGGPLFREVHVGGNLRLQLVGMLTSGWSERQQAHLRPNRATKASYLAAQLAPYVP